MLAASAAASLMLAGCGAGQRAAHATGSTVRVAERDFHISMPTHLDAGDHVFLVHNRGPVNHELIVVRASRSRLPLRSDGLTVDEEALDARTAGALEPGAPNKTRALRVRLRPGRYEFLCNMSGHYLGGMHRQVIVR
jgi:uncharacterized cupredoxin-like copper-binding protein